MSPRARPTADDMSQTGIVSDYNIETLVSRLRHKLDQGGVPPEAIVTVKKRGYRLASDE